jgi:hypothetical protein
MFWIFFIIVWKTGGFMFRNSDVVELVRGILDFNLEYHDPSDYPADYTCPFCCHTVLATKRWNMDDFPHDADCCYLVAKDMSTRLPKEEQGNPKSSGKKEETASPAGSTTEQSDVINPNYSNHPCVVCGSEGNCDHKCPGEQD